MSDLTQPQPTTNDSSLLASGVRKRNKVSQSTQEEENLYELTVEFNRNVFNAKARGDEWIEAPLAIVKSHNPGGLGTSLHYDFQGIKVCAEGTLDAAIDAFEKTTHSLHVND